MANFSWYERPPDTIDSPSIQILRPKANEAPLRGICLSEKVTGKMLHWMGRSVPHVEADPECPDCNCAVHPPVHCQRHRCPGCDADRPMRWEGYIALFQEQTGGIVIAAITPGAFGAFQIYNDQHGTLRGADVKLHRMGMKSTAPITVVLKRSEIPPGVLPTAPDLRPILTKVWGVADSKLASKPQSRATTQAVNEFEPTTIGAAVDQLARRLRKAK